MIDKLAEIRGKIDAIDKSLVSLIEERMQLVEQVVAYKRKHQLAVLDQNREALVLDKVASLVQQDQYRDAIVATFADIMAQSRRYQEGKLKDGH